MINLKRTMLILSCGAGMLMATASYGGVNGDPYAAIAYTTTAPSPALMVRKALLRDITVAMGKRWLLAPGFQGTADFMPAPYILGRTDADIYANLGQLRHNLMGRISDSALAGIYVQTDFFGNSVLSQSQLRGFLNQRGYSNADGMVKVIISAHGKP